MNDNAARKLKSFLDSDVKKNISSEMKICEKIKPAIVQGFNDDGKLIIYFLDDAAETLYVIANKSGAKFNIGETVKVKYTTNPAKGWVEGSNFAEAQSQNSGVGIKSPYDETSEIFNCYENQDKDDNFSPKNVSGVKGERNYAHAQNYNTKATGFASTAVGDSCDARGEASFAGGENSKAISSHSFVYGLNNVLTVPRSVAMGTGNVVQPSYSGSSYDCFALGNGNTTTGNNITAIGSANLLSGSNTYVFGGSNSISYSGLTYTVGRSNIEYNCDRDGIIGSSNTVQSSDDFHLLGNGNSVYYSSKSLVAGNDNYINNSHNSVILGKSNHIEFNTTNYKSVFCGGVGLVLQNDDVGDETHKTAIILGQYNEPDNENIFTIGNGKNEDHRSNIFYIDKNGIVHCAGVNIFGEGSLGGGSSANFPFVIETTEWKLNDDSDYAYYADINDENITVDDSVYLFFSNASKAYCQNAGVVISDINVDGKVRLYSEAVPSADIVGAYTLFKGV